MNDGTIERFFVSARERLLEERETLCRHVVAFPDGVVGDLQRAREEKQRIDLLLAEDFNVFEFVDPGENRLSDILAWLLAPSGSHGQGDLFLRRLLAGLSLPLDLADVNARVYREEATTYLPNPLRRLDILIDSGASGVGMENKPRSLEQPDQVRDYCTQLQKKYGGRWALLYLSGDGSSPASLPVPELVRLEAQHHFRLVSYVGGLCGWLEECRKACQAEKVRIFLADYRDFVRGRFKTSVADWRNH